MGNKFKSLGEIKIQNRKKSLEYKKIQSRNKLAKLNNTSNKDQERIEKGDNFDFEEEKESNNK